MRVPLLLSLLLLAGGCAHYEYDLTRPPDLAQHIGTKEDVVAKVDPLEYRFRSYEDHLIIRIYNPTDDRIQLLGDQSSVVDPTGQSHAVKSAMLESHSFVKLILPPTPVYVEPYGPTIGIRFGMRAETDVADHPVYLMSEGRQFHRGFRHREFIGGWGWNYWDPWYYDDYAPRYYVLYDNDNSYWNWRGETSVRLMLSFERNGKTFGDEFEFRRVKMK